MIPMRLLNQATNFACDLELRVVSCVEIAADSFLLGCAFSRPLAAEELQMLL
jgi:hypothetical protein